MTNPIVLRSWGYWWRKSFQLRGLDSAPQDSQVCGWYYKPFCSEIFFGLFHVSGVPYFMVGNDAFKLEVGAFRVSVRKLFFRRFEFIFTSGDFSVTQYFWSWTNDLPEQLDGPFFLEVAHWMTFEPALKRFADIWPTK